MFLQSLQAAYQNTLMAHGTVSISIDELRPGVTCSHPIVDDHGVLLLGAHTAITQQLISGLRDRGVNSIEVDPRDLATIRGTKKKAPSAKRERSSDGSWDKNKPLKGQLVDRHDEGLSEERSEQLNKRLEEAKQRFEELKQKIAKERIRSVDSLVDVSNGYAESMVDDHDQTLGMIGKLHIENPDEQSIRLSVLGMAIAIELGLDGVRTLEVGMAGLLHDIGLLAMGPRFRRPLETMNESDRWEYKKHPLVSVLCLADVMEVPASVQLAMQQVHEQYDGSGYPRGAKGPRIHLYARVLNVADAFLQLVSPTDHRPAVVPHDALGLMLHKAARGVFDPKVIRAFLNVESLFPLGSLVELNSGDLAQVIRRPRSGFAAPVLLDVDGQRIELESTSMQVVRPVCDPSSSQVRIPIDAMQNFQWHPSDSTLSL